VSSPLFEATRIVIPSFWGCSSTHTAITLRLSSDVADRNAKLLAISFSLEALNRYEESIPDEKTLFFGGSGTLFSDWKRVVLRSSSWRVIDPPHIGVSILRILKSFSSQAYKHKVILEVEVVDIDDMTYDMRSSTVNAVGPKCTCLAGTDSTRKIMKGNLTEPHATVSSTHFLN
jgi:hypothetical protein